MPGDPIFDKSDSSAVDELPAELQGKTPQEVAAYYQRREQILTDRLRQQPPTPKKDDVVDDKIDLFNDPTGSLNRVVDRKVREGMDRMGAIAVPAIVNSCKIALKDAHPADYVRFIGEVEKRITAMSPEAQMNPKYWELMYATVKGEVSDKLVEEALVKEREKGKSPVEKGNPPGQKPAEPQALSDDEKVVARKFGIPDTEYREASTRYEETEGKLPFTYDSRIKKKKAS